MTGNILNIQHYAVHDGPGIRTLVFFKGCPLRCAWCCNPESQQFRSQLRYIPYRCKACLECAPFCPYGSVTSENGIIKRSFTHCYSCETKPCIDHCMADAVSLSGREYTVEELTRKVAADIDFYRNSGGGVTFSGGEPFAQAEFLIAMLQSCKALGIHTAIETCGWAGRNDLRRAMPFTDLFLFDLKLIDPEEHYEYTGKHVQPILDNLEFLTREGANIVIRFPLVPGITNTQSNLSAIAAVMQSNKLKHIVLEPYHTLGSDKYGEHGLSNSLAALEPMSPAVAEEARLFFTGLGLDCEVI
jgi:pyruvate formate lyase activating enzyme